jgi:hypothetical protein
MEKEKIMRIALENSADHWQWCERFANFFCERFPHELNPSYVVEWIRRIRYGSWKYHADNESIRVMEKWNLIN